MVAQNTYLPEAGPVERMKMERKGRAEGKGKHMSLHAAHTYSRIHTRLSVGEDGDESTARMIHTRLSVGEDGEE